MMHKAGSLVAIAALALVATSCTEPDAPRASTEPVTTPHLKPSFEVIEEGPQDPPPGVPSEYQQSTTISIEAYTGFHDSTAYGDAIVHYGGTDATASMHIDVTRGATSYGSSDAGKTDTHLLPAPRELAVHADRLLPGTCGFIVNGEAGGTVKNRFPIDGSFLEWGVKSATKPAPGTAAPACPPPKARLLASYGGSSGAVLNLTIPEDRSIVVGLSASGSAPGEAGGPPITSYAWFANGTSLGGGVSRNLTLISSKSLALTVTDEMNATGSATGAINISYTNPCDDPRTRTVETCDDGGGGGGSGLVGMGGSSRDIGDYHHAPGGTYVCYFTDWYQWSGSTWVYQFTELDYCDIE